MSTSKILIAGATGTNGRALIDTLVAKGVAVRALVRNIESARATLLDGIELVQGDLGGPDSLSAAFDGVDKAYVVTAVQPNTVELFHNFYDAAQAADVSHVVKFSGMGASEASPSEVIRQHAASDADLRASGLPYTILRPNSFHQNMLWQAGGIASTGKFYLPLGDAAQSTIDVRDIAEITSTILTTDGHIGKTYDLTGPESITFHDVARIIADVRGAPVEYVPITPEAAEQAMRDQGMPEWSAHSLAEIQALFATGQYAQVTEDAERLLARAPRSFRDFATDHKGAFMV
ncbi:MULTISPECIES: SDR family oxidoreductase [unclassified Ruegeria]|uniref:SDR family oxidoreductase n=1 Tax=unclassified Ruegeria TaxID=2625375 RepID=UPI001ADACE06|nr:MULTISPECIES: SDR family oxidoreductase [unclassified Ruegeria]MBO9410794.1 SDR family oxidoreductase [Ruegeria sp. R8_1]MBO9414995.1 SDR family oxidoreductase [Ruegeria sp. R8_2]